MIDYVSTFWEDLHKAFLFVNSLIWFGLSGGVKFALSNLQVLSEFI